MSEKIQKILAHFGLGSRREIERWIHDGRVHINGQPAKLGMRIHLTAKVTIDNQRIRLTTNKPFERRVLIYHKPLGEICSRSDPRHHVTVFEHLPRLRDQRWVMIGRLDMNTSGLLIFTNEGEFAYRLSHPSYQIEREYVVRVLGKVNKSMLDRLKKGVMLKEKRAAFTSIQASGGSGANRWYHVVLKEGRNREVRRLWESQGVTVSRLMRIRFGNVSLPHDLKKGHFFELKTKAIKKLARLVDLD
ncbi:23S rRNA pseudouridylate synthase B [Rickettsiella grylli]|uniref:23S rRNA pseudouridine(2605) synthase RluB n=1 Tax=Rickettsiella grylli TaxID=59196 RepID=UPI0008FCFF11|nr:pseudouridine synthase [Rickettsiella grylli]OIZ98161.1 23S rRNA pseudouridylate synthase B [Rickettsiella grylli]